MLTQFGICALRTLGVLATLATTAANAPPTLQALLHNNRHSILVGPEGIGGEGGPLVAEAVKQARFVALGEDHFTREVPDFAAGLCEIMAPDLAALFVEAGPLAIAKVEPMLKRPDHDSQTAKFVKDYPNAIAFLDSRADNDFAANCGQLSQRSNYRIYGLDQEFLGAGGFIIDEILATRLTAEARRTMLDLKAKEQADAASARASGDPSSLLLTSITDAQISQVEKALAAGGTAKARVLFGALVESHRIYEKNRLGTWDSNLVRSKLMKREFVKQVPQSGHVLLKFGAFHLFKGVGPLRLRDLGNLVAELADAEGRPSVHILLLGVQGEQATFTGYGKPLGREKFRLTDNPKLAFLKIAENEMVTEGWTLFDLRKLRETRIADATPDWLRTIDGYDFLILAPTITPSETVAETRPPCALHQRRGRKLPARLC